MAYKLFTGSQSLVIAYTVLSLIVAQGALARSDLSNGGFGLKIGQLIRILGHIKAFHGK